MKRIAFIGLGAMGKPIAERLLQGGYDLTVFDVHRDSMASLIAAGAREATSPKAAAEHAQAVFTMVPDAPDAEEVALGAGWCAARNQCRNVLHRHEHHRSDHDATYRRTTGRSRREDDRLSGWPNNTTRSRRKTRSDDGRRVGRHRRHDARLRAAGRHLHPLRAIGQRNRDEMRQQLCRDGLQCDFRRSVRHRNRRPD